MQALRRIVAAMTIMSLLGCGGNSDNSPSAPEEFNPFYRDHMRSLVGRMAAYARQVTADFIVIPQNGLQLLTLNGEPGGRLAGEYIAAIDGIGQEELFYGFDRDNEATPASVTDQWMPFLDRAEGAGTQVLVVDYCDSPARVDDSYLRNSSKGYISYAGPRELDRISAYPQIPHHMNVDDVTSLGRAQNLLYLLNPGNYDSRADFVAALAATNYDLVLVDAFFDRDDPLTAVDVALLGVKANGGRRLVLAYFSIGEAEDYRYYWRDVWDDDPPAWLAAENKDWRGNFKVRYWDPEWQAVLFGADDAYLDRILAAGFDGVYLDIIDAFDYFEQNGD